MLSFSYDAEENIYYTGQFSICVKWQLSSEGTFFVEWFDERESQLNVLTSRRSCTRSYHEERGEGLVS